MLPLLAQQTAGLQTPLSDSFREKYFLNLKVICACPAALDDIPLNLLPEIF
jgi:hypothetical protein